MTSVMVGKRLFSFVMLGKDCFLMLCVKASGAVMDEEGKLKGSGLHLPLSEAVCQINQQNLYTLRKILLAFNTMNIAALCSEAVHHKIIAVPLMPYIALSFTALCTT